MFIKQALNEVQTSIREEEYTKFQHTEHEWLLFKSIQINIKEYNVCSEKFKWKNCVLRDYMQNG